jgi:hypothetical protein
MVDVNYPISVVDHHAISVVNHDPIASMVDHYAIPIVMDHDVAIIDDHAVVAANHRRRLTDHNVGIIHHDAACRGLDDPCRSPHHHVGHDCLHRRLEHPRRRGPDDRARRNHHGRADDRRGLDDPGRRRFHGNRHGPRHDRCGRRGNHRRPNGHRRLDGNRRRGEQRFAVALPVEVEPCQAGPRPLAFEDQQRLVVVIAPEFAHRVAPLIGDAEAGQLLVGSRGVEMDLDVQVLRRTAAGLGPVIRPSTVERQHLGQVPVCRAGGCGVRGAGLLRPEIRDTQQQQCCDQ